MNNTMKVNKTERSLDAIPDTVDFRDKLFVPTLREVPPTVSLQSYRERKTPILDQGSEGACTGFGLAAVVHYLLQTRQVLQDVRAVSSRMLYEMAKRYDEWEGEDYSGSSARGAMKGWHKHGVCDEDLWPYEVNRCDRRLTRKRSLEARNRPLGAYFRVNHRDIVAMHSAIVEVGILYATAFVHEGWSWVNSRGIIDFTHGNTGGHAFAIVAYDRDGFWIQNSWGEDWGKDGFARISYDDWLQNGMDIWVARLGAPINLQDPVAVSIGQNRRSGNPAGYSFNDLRPHIVSTGNEGKLRRTGTYGTDEDDVRELFSSYLPAITKDWKKKRILLFAHGGLVPEDSAVQRLAENRDHLLKNAIYPISFIWKSDYWSTLKNALADALRSRRPEGFLDATKDFLLDRLDDALEPIARYGTGKLQWEEMKENATLATLSSDGGAYFFLKELRKWMKQNPETEIHLIGHSAGSVYLGPLVQLLCSPDVISSGPMKGRKGLGVKVSTFTLWAAACTNQFFHEYYAHPIKKKQIKDFALYNLTDEIEQSDHCAEIYHKSLLYLVSGAFEESPRIPLIRKGTPILGMEKFADSDDALKNLMKSSHCHKILSPISNLSGSTSHGDFDNDPATLHSTMNRILGKGATWQPTPSLGTASAVERRETIKDML